MMSKRQTPTLSRRHNGSNNLAEPDAGPGRPSKLSWLRALVTPRPEFTTVRICAEGVSSASIRTVVNGYEFSGRYSAVKTRNGTSDLRCLFPCQSSPASSCLFHNHRSSACAGRGNRHGRYPRRRQGHVILRACRRNPRLDRSERLRQIDGDEAHHGHRAARCRLGAHRRRRGCGLAVAQNRAAGRRNIANTVTRRPSSPICVTRTCRTLPTASRNKQIARADLRGVQGRHWNCWGKERNRRNM